jgi:hypothetical protein
MRNLLIALKERSANDCIIPDNGKLYDIEFYSYCEQCSEFHSRRTRLSCKTYHSRTRLTKLICMAKLEMPTSKRLKEMLAVAVPNNGFPSVSHLCPNSACHCPDHLVCERAGLNHQRMKVLGQ